MRDSIKQSGVLELVLKDEHGNVKETHTHNLVVNVGLAAIAKRMYDNTEPIVTHMGVGTSTTAAAATQTALVTPLGARIATGTATTVTTTVANDSTRWTADFGPGVSTGAITEAGLFTALTLGNMWARSVFSVVNKGALDTMSITWTIRSGT